MKELESRSVAVLSSQSSSSHRSRLEATARDGRSVWARDDLAALGFAIIGDVPARVVGAEEREHWGYAEGTTIAGHAVLEYSA
ncbi:MAG: hypothetical protein JNK05_36055 [Myxococcales bacterium]|nr:hypothetical protein [Myxococcales bacterium]